MEVERPESLRAALWVYFVERDSILSPDGILRIFSVLRGGRCGGGALATGGAGTALGGAIALTALSALAACALPQREPLMWLCFPFALMAAVLALLSVVVVYRAVGRRWDRARDSAATPAPPAEQDV